MLCYVVLELYLEQDCIDMDCDGPDHAIVIDTDGTFLGCPLGTPCSIIPNAEIRFDESRIPVVLRSDGTNGPLIPASEVSKQLGISRGHTG